VRPTELRQFINGYAALLLEFHDDNLMVGIIQVLDLVLRAISPDHLAGFAPNLLLFAVLGSHDMSIIYIYNQSIISGSL
jgi:hypothetical protein